MTFFTDANRTRAKEIVARYPRPKSAILPLAHLAQDQNAWLSPEAMAEIAELTGVTAAEVQGTCSFYNLQTLSTMVQGGLVADGIAIISSIDPIMGDVDR